MIWYDINRRYICNSYRCMAEKPWNGPQSRQQLMATFLPNALFFFCLFVLSFTFVPADNDVFCTLWKEKDYDEYWPTNFSPEIPAILNKTMLTFIEETDHWGIVWWCDGSVCPWRPRRSDHKRTQVWRRCRHKVAFQTSSEYVTTSNTLTTISALPDRKTPDAVPTRTVKTGARNPCVISPNSVAFRAHYVKVVEDTPTLPAAECDICEG